MRVRPDPFIVALLVTAVVASVVPAQGDALEVLKIAAKIAIGVLFFLYGARLSTREALAGLAHWRLHSVILGTTFVFFPLLGLGLGLASGALGDDLYAGVLLLTLVPSTVQSSVAFTSIARGNVAGSLVSASLSNLLGVALTPLLVAALMTSGGGAKVDAGAVGAIVLQLLAPFVLGQLSRPLTARWVARHDRRLRLVDRGSILFVVYLAFSEGRNRDVWDGIDALHLGALAAVCVGLLAVVLGWTWLVGRRFDRADRISIVFCGSHKSLASGLPMASVLFASETVALIVLPLMLYHQLQLVVCSWLASRWSRQ